MQLLLRELIDTLWNVNSVFKRSHSSVVPELIDTLWNVNFSASHFSYTFSDRINRYIMECKYKEQTDEHDYPWELIDTLWNVNMS